MNIDSRNPLLYCCGLRIDDSFGNTFCGKHLHGWEVVERSYQSIDSAMYIDQLDVADYEDQYVSLEDYDKLKAKLEHLERKHAKLKRRHDNVGAKYLVAKQERDYLISCQSVYTKEDFLP